MGNDIKVGDRWIGDEHPPFIVAEMSGNHNHSLDRACDIVDAAAEAGCQAIKLQTFTAESLTLDCDKPDFQISEDASLWKGETLFSLYRKNIMPREWHEPIFQRSRQRGILAFSSPFDEEDVAFLEELDCPVYKVASFENNYLPLIRAVARTGKPVIVSTGLATIEELSLVVDTIRECGNEQIVLLKCTSAYPSDARDANLLTLPDMKERFACQVGLSDHTPGIGVAVAAVALGAVVIEKHMTLRRADGGIDASYSMEAEEMKFLVAETKRSRSARGEVFYGTTEQEQPSRRFKRSIYVSKDMRTGERLTQGNIRIVRPGFGLAPRHYDEILGRRAARELERGTPLTWDCLE